MLGGYKPKPTREVAIEWHSPKDPMARRETFVTVEDSLPFDILICKK